MSDLTERLETERDLCKNDGAYDIAKLLHETIDELARLSAELDGASNALDNAAHELGIPQPGYIAPVSNVANLLWAWLDKYRGKK